MVFNSKFLQIFIINFLAVTKNDDRPFEKKFLAFSTSQVHPQKNWTPTKKKLKKKELKKTKIFFFLLPLQMKSNGNCLERRKNGDLKWLLLKL
jgi:hypothetical protein